jgi:hypothetical protein
LQEITLNTPATVDQELDGSTVGSHFLSQQSGGLYQDRQVVGIGDAQGGQDFLSQQFPKLN